MRFSIFVLGYSFHQKDGRLACYLIIRLNMARRHKSMPFVRPSDSERQKVSRASRWMPPLDSLQRTPVSLQLLFAIQYYSQESNCFCPFTLLFSSQLFSDAATSYLQALTTSFGSRNIVNKLEIGWLAYNF